MRLLPILLLVVLLSAHSAFVRAAQTPYEDDWRWVRFTAAEGLPSDRVQSVLDTATETWAATHGGLAWYDGWRWHEIEGVPEQSIYSLTANGEGALFVGAESGAYVGGREGFVPIGDLAGLPVPWVAQLADGSALLLAVRGSAQELFRYVDGELAAFDLPDSETPSSTNQLLSMEDGVPWLVTDTGIYALLRDHRWQRLLGPTEATFRVPHFASSPRGEGLVTFHSPASMMGIWEWGPNVRPRRNEGEGPGVMRAGDVASDGEALVVHEAGEVRLRRSGQWQSLSRVPDALRSAGHISYRANGDVWVSTNHGLYLCRRTSQRWTRWRDARINSPSNRIRELTTDENGSVWLATAGGVVALDSVGARLPIDPVVEEGTALVTGLARDDTGRIWASSDRTFFGLRVWDGSAWQPRTSKDDGRALGRIYRLCPRRAGGLWLLNEYRGDTDEIAWGILTLENDAIRGWPQYQELAGQAIFDLVEDASGRVWVATQKGVSRWDETGWRHWDIGKGWDGPTACLAVAPDGAIWVGRVLASLGRIEPDGTYHTVEDESGASLFEVYRVGYGDQDRLWIATINGLYCLKDGVWSKFEIESDMASTRLTTLYVARGRVHVGSRGGGIFTLNLAEASGPPPRATLSEIAVGHAEVRARWTVQTWWGQEDPTKTRTRWRIDGQPWSGWSPAREATVDGLNAGAHEIEVQAKGLFGAVGELRTAMSFSIPMPWYQRPAYWVPIGSLTLALLWVGFVSMLNRRRAAHALRESELEYRLLMEQASDAIFVGDDAGRVLRANSKACELLMLPAEAVLDLSLPEVLDPQCSLDALLTTLRTEGAQEFRLRAPNGQLIPVEAGARFFDDGRVQVILRDVSERHRLEAQRQTLEQRIAESQRFESLGRLAGGVAHDFNNLLTVIMGGADLAGRKVVGDSELSELLQSVTEAAGQAGELTQQLLAYSGKRVINAESVDLNALLGEMSRLLYHSVRENAQLVVRCDSELPRIRADAAQLRQVILNLILNASDAIGEARGTIELSTTQSMVTNTEALQYQGAGLPKAGRWVVLRVHDSGKGIDPETLPRIFDPFYTTKAKGHGLGLAAVLGILRAHGGYVRVEAESGRGTLFTVLLPVAQDAPAASAPVEPWGAWRASGRALVIDDETAVLRVAVSLMNEIGFETLSAASGEAGLELFRRHADDVVLTLLDVKMPGMNGPATLAGIRALRPDALVVFMSGYAESMASREATLERPSAFLAKPFNIEELRTVVRRLLESRGLTGQG